jgi:hypothetical protein
MSFPPLVHYKTESEYFRHYEKIYCVGPILAFDGIPVWFRKSRFNHAFFESSHRDNRKDKFSETRAQRIDWIKATLQNRNAMLYCGWDKSKRKYDPRWRVSVVYDNYVVVIELSKKQDGTLKGEFRNAYVADNSIEKIKSSPKWTVKMMNK